MTPQDAPNPARRLTARITGDVQAVGFRYRTLQQALRLGLTGLAENRNDGSVLVVAEGSGPALEELLQWLNSPAAPGSVGAVQDSWSEATGEFGTFRTA